MELRASTVLYVGAAALGLGLAYQVFVSRKAIAKAAGDTLEAVNPVNPENIFARGANAVTRALTGNQDDTLGTWLASKFDPATQRAEQVAKDATAKPGAGATPAIGRIGDERYMSSLPPGGLPGVLDRAPGAPAPNAPAPAIDPFYGSDFFFGAP